jgi:hypothetical protein
MFGSKGLNDNECGGSIAREEDKLDPVESELEKKICCAPHQN